MLRKYTSLGFTESNGMVCLVGVKYNKVKISTLPFRNHCAITKRKSWISIAIMFRKSIAQDDENRGGGGILEVPCGRGKCLGKDTLVMKHDGCFEKVQNINVGDYLMGDDSKPRKVNSIARGMETLYKVHTDNGYYVVNESHILSLKCVRKYGIYEKGTIIDICIKDLLKYPKNVYSGTYPPLCGYRVGLQFPRKPVKDDPYMVGHLWKTEIHEDYIKNAFALRCEVLAGVLDAVATNHGCYYTIWTDNDQKKDQLVYLIRSLALNCVTQYHENYQNWSLEIYGPLLGKIPVPNDRTR